MNFNQKLTKAYTPNTTHTHARTHTTHSPTPTHTHAHALAHTLHTHAHPHTRTLPTYLAAHSSIIGGWCMLIANDDKNKKRPFMRQSRIDEAPFNNPSKMSEKPRGGVFSWNRMRSFRRSDTLSELLKKIALLASKAPLDASFPGARMVASGFCCSLFESGVSSSSKNKNWLSAKPTI